MNDLLVFVLLLQVHLQLSSCSSLPPFINACKRNDPDLNECFLKAVNEIKPNLVRGIPELDLPPGEPLHYPNTSVSTGGGSSVSLEGHLWNQMATGLMNFEIQKLELDLDKAHCKSTFLFPNVRLQGEYRLRGKVLLFEIDTQGHFQANCTDILCEAEWHGRHYTKNGKDHIEIEKIDVLVKPKKMATYFTNLINGNEQLTETLNLAINENVDVLREELAPVTSDTLGRLAIDYFNRVFRKFPVDELFLRD